MLGSYAVAIHAVLFHVLLILTKAKKTWSWVKLNVNSKVVVNQNDFNAASGANGVSGMVS